MNDSLPESREPSEPEPSVTPSKDRGVHVRGSVIGSTPPPILLVAAATLVLIVALVWRETTLTAVTPTSTSSLASFSPEPDPSPSPTPEVVTPAPTVVEPAWIRLGTIPVASIDVGNEMRIAGFEGGYVAIANGRTIWFSEDARTWSPIELPYDGPSEVHFDALATNGHEVLITGGYAHEPCRQDPPDVGGGGPACPLSPVSWISDDGRTWRTSFPWRGPADPPGYSQGSEFVAAWSVPSGGWDAALSYWRGEILSGVELWHSDDGVGWVALDSLAIPVDAPTDLNPWPWSHAAVADSSGRRVAWQWWVYDGFSDWATWLASSPDGRGWNSLETFPGSGAEVSVGVAPMAGSDAWVFAGSTSRDNGRASTPTVWATTDLRSWTTIELPASGIGRVDSLTRARDGYVAVGSFWNGQDAKSQTWLSQDGRTWIDLAPSWFGRVTVADGPAGLIGVGIPNGEDVIGVWRLGERLESE